MREACSNHRWALWTTRQVCVAPAQIRVLVVDDNPIAAEALAAALDAEGFTTRYALGGVEAINISSKWMPHVVILDINMPEYDGFQTASIMRRLATTRDAKIIAFTALGESDVLPRGPAVGFDGYCQKGNSLAMLTDLIGANMPGTRMAGGASQRLGLN